MNSRGFTLIELIITIVLIGVLAVTVVPRFFGSAAEDAYMLRDRTLAMMRAVQLEAMHNINSRNCVKIGATLVAPPEERNCANPVSTEFNDFLVIDSSAANLTFSTSNNNGESFNAMAFGSLGRPVIAFDSSDQTTDFDNMAQAFDCRNTCRIQVGNQGVCVSGEGLIYACQ